MDEVAGEANERLVASHRGKFRAGAQTCARAILEAETIAPDTNTTSIHIGAYLYMRRIDPVCATTPP